MGPDSWRVFCAIALPDHVRTGISEYIALLRESSPLARIRWTEQANLHVTVKFIGEIEPRRVVALNQAVSRSLQSVSPFKLAINGSGAFPPTGLPRILWLGVTDPSGQLALIHSALEEACMLEGFARDERPLHAHVTIARPRLSAGSRRLARLHKAHGFAPEDFLVTEVLVMKSEPGESGSTYTTVSRRRLS